MALHLQFASLSLSAAVDQQTGNLSVFEVVDEVRAPQVPFQIQNLVISLALFKSEPHQNGGMLSIDLTTPDSRVSRVGHGELGIPDHQRRMKALFRFSNFPILQFGVYSFQLTWTDLAGKKEGEAVLDFEVIQAEKKQENAPPMAH
jgi:hypothetical protein